MAYALLEEARSRLGTVSRWAIVALGVTIPISTTADSILLVVLLVVALVVKHAEDRLQPTIRHPATLAWLAFFLLVTLGTLHGSAPASD